MRIKKRAIKNNIVMTIVVLLPAMLMLTMVLKAENDKNDKDYGNISSTDSVVTDVDGNTYATVTIGIQVWMAENLKVTHYRDGSEIPYVSGDTVWSRQATGGCGEVGNYATWWSSTSYDSIYAWYWGLYHGKASVRFNPGHKASGFSIRCVKD
ncbi:MAG: hypothetical protein JSW64_07545 [Candidatus Zixiibacteriota bacterium]|nr:MAG: hypothetical protein JSW64_07545 [candidate division Zixibacteria bacterium]